MFWFSKTLSAFGFLAMQEVFLHHLHNLREKCEESGAVFWLRGSFPFAVCFVDVCCTLTEFAVNNATCLGTCVGWCAYSIETFFLA